MNKNNNIINKNNKRLYDVTVCTNCSQHLDGDCETEKPLQAQCLKVLYMAQPSS